MLRSSLLFGGQNLFNYLPRQLFCTRMILNRRINSSFSSNHPGAIHPILQFVLVQNSLRRKDINKFWHPSSSKDLCLFFCIYSSSMLASILLPAHIYIIHYTVYSIHLLLGIDGKLWWQLQQGGMKCYFCAFILGHILQLFNLF